MLFEADKIGISDSELIDRCANHEVLVSQNAQPGFVRAVTHLGATSDDIELAIDRIRSAFP